MNKVYNVEVKLDTKKWTLLHVASQQKDAMHYVKENPNRSYPVRIVRVVRTTVFEEKK
jgi:hypothetical protein